jgi:hypothetical protein
MSTEIQTPNKAAAEAPMLAPEGVVAQLRIVRQQIAEVTPLTRQQKKALYRYAAVPNEVLQASINAVGASANVQQALGDPADDIRQMVEESNRWTAVEDELRGMLQGVAGANLIRRQRIGLRAMQAYVISRQLSRDPSHAVLLPHVQEIRRLRSLSRRKKPAPPAPETPPAAASAQEVES